MHKTIYQCEQVERIVFHYNKAHNTNPEIPCWIIKHKGITYYVHHLDSKVGFSTKETPDNPHTKGALQFKGKLRIIEKNGIVTAEIE